MRSRGVLLVLSVFYLAALAGCVQKQPPQAPPAPCGCQKK